MAEAENREEAEVRYNHHASLCQNQPPWRIIIQSFLTLHSQASGNISREGMTTTTVTGVTVTVTSDSPQPPRAPEVPPRPPVVEKTSVKVDFYFVFFLLVSFSYILVFLQPLQNSHFPFIQAVLEKLNDFLTENNLEQQIAEERKMIMQKIEGKNEEILQKKETHRHKLNEVHEAYKREIQKENERHLDDLKVGCQSYWDQQGSQWINKSYKFVLRRSLREG